MVTVGERAGSRAPVRRRPPRVSSVRLKIVMALTGAAMLLYLVVHMLGNLKIFFGEQALKVGQCPLVGFADGVLVHLELLRAEVHPVFLEWRDEAS